MPMPRPRLGPQGPTAPLPRRSFLAKAGAVIAGLALLGRARRAEAATEALNPFVGEIMMFAGNFAPVGWGLCNGQLLAIAQNQALFSLLGTTYGGNGQTTFALPDLRGRAPIHFGQGPGLSNYPQGQVAGEENHTLIATEMPTHTHVAHGDPANGTSDTPTGLLPARNPGGTPAYGAAASAQLAGTYLATAGGSQPHNNMQPYLVLNYCIALTGVFPSRP